LLDEAIKRPDIRLQTSSTNFRSNL